MPRTAEEDMAVQADRTHGLRRPAFDWDASTGVWLVNTGWTGGPSGVGSRMKMAYTRAMITATLVDRLDTVRYQRDWFLTCPDVPDAVLDPPNTWPDPAKCDDQARKRAQMSVETSGRSSRTSHAR